MLAAFASLLGGKPWLAVDVIMIGCVPLAGLTAFFAARRVTQSVLARVWAGAAFALLPVGMGAVAAGRLGAAVAFTLIPLIGVLAARIFTQPRRRARRAAWAAGLVVAIAAAFVPLVWVAAVLAAGLGAVAFGRIRRGILLNLGIVALVPPVLLVPWSLSVFSHPAMVFLQAGQQSPGLASAHLAARSLLLLSPGGPGLPPYWVTAGLVLAALAALLLTGRRTLVAVGWSVALLGLLISALVSRVLVTPEGGGPAVAAWPGISLAIAAAGLLLAATVAAGTLPARLAGGKWRSARGVGVALVALVACSAPLLAAGSWLHTGVRGPVAVTSGPVLPAFVSVSSHTGLQVRTLVLRSGNGDLTYSVLRGADPLVGSTELTEPAAVRQALDRTVASLIAPSGGDAGDQGQKMASFDIGYVLVPAPVDAGLARVLDGVPSLRPVSVTSAFHLWRVAETLGRARVVESTGRVVPVASGPVAVSAAAAPPAGGTLVLAEPAGGWTATLNGHPLTPLPAPADGWAQAFRLPPGGGRLDVTHSQIGRDLILALEALAFLAVAALGLPGASKAAESTSQAADEPTAGRRRAGRAGNRSRPMTPDRAADRLGGRGPSRRATGAPDARPGPAPGTRPGTARPAATRPGGARSGAAANLAGAADRPGPTPADQRDRAVPGGRAVSADMPPDERGAPADLRGRPAGRRAAPANGRGGAPWDERPPPAGRTGRPPLGHRGPAPVDQRGPGAVDQRGPVTADSGGIPADGSLWDERRPPASRAGRTRANRPDAGLRNSELGNSEQADTWLADAGLADSEAADSGAAEPEATGQRGGGFWGRRGRPSPDQRDGPARDRAGGSPGSGTSPAGPPGGGRRDAGLPGAGRRVGGRPANDHPVGAGRGRPPGDRRGIPGAQRPDRAPVARGRLPGDDEALPPLTPLPPLAPRAPLPPSLSPLPPPLPRRAGTAPEDADPDGVPASWRSEPPQEPGEADW